MMDERSIRLLITELVDVAYKAGAAYPINKDIKENIEKLTEKIIQVVVELKK